MRSVLLAVSVLLLAFCFSGCTSPPHHSDETKDFVTFAKVETSTNPATNGEIYSYPDAKFQFEKPMEFMGMDGDDFNPGPPWLMATFFKGDPKVSEILLEVKIWGSVRPDIYHQLTQKEPLPPGEIVEYKIIYWQGHRLPIRIAQDSYQPTDKSITEYSYEYKTTLPFSPQMIDLEVSATTGIPQDEVAQAFYQVLNSIHGQWNAQAVHEPAH
jgi:hypothetical protein